MGGPEDGDIEVTAVFEPDAFYSLTLLEDGEGVAEGSAPLHTEGYGLGESIVLEATPDPGWAFSHWLDNSTGNVISYRSPCEVKAKETNSYTAVFRALNTLTLTTEGQGRVHRMTNSLIYEEDASVTLTPVPNPGWKFTGWTGDATGTDIPLQLTMDGPKEITASFAPDFNVQVDINDDGNWTNDDEYEEQAPGEFVRLSDGRDNGATTARIVTLGFGDAYWLTDDTQPLRFPLMSGIDTVDVDLSQVPEGLDIHFGQGVPYTYYVLRGLPSFNIPGEITFPHVVSEKGSFPTKVTMFISGEMDTQATFPVTFEARSGSVSGSDTVYFTVVNRLGQPGYFAAAHDYIVENDSRAFTSIESMRKDEPGGNPDAINEDYRVLVFPQHGTRLEAIDALYNPPGGPFRNIYGATTAFGECDVIINGLWFQNRPPENDISEIANGLLVSNFALSKLSHLISREGYIKQNSTSANIEIGAVQQGTDPFNIYASGSQDPIDQSSIHIYIDDPATWNASNYISDCMTAVRGLDNPNAIRNPGPTGFLGSLSVQTPSGSTRLLCTAMTDIQSMIPYALYVRKYYGQDGLFVQKFISSGGQATEIFCVDGGGSVAMAYKPVDAYKFYVIGPRHIWNFAGLSGEGYCNNYIGFIIDR